MHELSSWKCLKVFPNFLEKKIFWHRVFWDVDTRNNSDTQRGENFMALFLKITFYIKLPFVESTMGK